MTSPSPRFADQPLPAQLDTLTRMLALVEQPLGAAAGVIPATAPLSPHADTLTRAALVAVAQAAVAALGAADLAGMAPALGTLATAWGQVAALQPVVPSDLDPLATALRAQGWTKAQMSAWLEQEAGVARLSLLCRADAGRLTAKLTQPAPPSPEDPDWALVPAVLHGDAPCTAEQRADILRLQTALDWPAAARLNWLQQHFGKGRLQELTIAEATAALQALVQAQAAVPVGEGGR